MGAENSLEKMLAQQLAANHRSIMKLSGIQNRLAESLQLGSSEQIATTYLQGVNVEMCRVANAIARQQSAFNEGLLTWQKLKSKGRQEMVVQHVYVTKGGQAIVASREGLASQGGRPKMSDEPHVSRLKAANAAPRCGAKRKSDGKPCQQAAMRNGRCRMHGGTSTGPKTPEGLERSRRAKWKHGNRSREAIESRRRARVSYLVLRSLLRHIQ
jgi:hypothetical protein